MLDPDVFSQHAPLIRRNLGTNFTHPSFSSLSLSLSLALRDLCRSPIRITAARMPAFLLWHRPLDSDMPAASAGAKKQFGRQLFQGWAFLGVCWIPSSEAAESSQPAPSPLLPPSQLQSPDQQTVPFRRDPKVGPLCPGRMNRWVWVVIPEVQVGYSSSRWTISPLCSCSESALDCSTVLLGLWWKDEEEQPHGHCSAASLCLPASVFPPLPPFLNMLCFLSLCASCCC